MGISVLYRAIPPTSQLYRRAHQEKAFAVLISSLFSYGGSIVNFFEMDPEEINEILEEVIAEFPDIFGSPLEADDWIGEFRAELRRTRQVYPGLSQRIASLEKSSSEIRARLSQVLSTGELKDVDGTVDLLLYGNQTFAAHLLSGDSRLDWIGLIPPDMVQSGAKILQPIEASQLFAGDRPLDDWCGEHFQRWRSLYLEAAKQGEAIWVGVF